MKSSIVKLGIGVLFASILLFAGSSAVLGASRTFSFDTAEYGEADNPCGVNAKIPLFNRPEYGNQTKDYIVDPAGCEQGVCGPSAGSDSLLTHAYGSSTPGSNEIRFSWVDPTNDDTWLRLITQASGMVAPVYPNPTVHLGVGSSISMQIMVYGTLGTEAASTCLPDVPGAQLEFALALRETGRNLPLGVDGGAVGPIELVGVDGIGGSVDLLTPIGGVAVPNDYDFHLLRWEFADAFEPFDGEVDAVYVSIDGGAPVTKSIVSFTGDGILSADYDRGALDSLVIRKPASDQSTTKWFINIDDVTIEAPVDDPVAVQAPVFEYESQVTVIYIDPNADEVTLYKDSGSGPVLFAGPAAGPFLSGTHTFTGLDMNGLEGQELIATQTIDSVESAHSAPVPILSAVLMKDSFDSYADQAAFNAAWPVVGDQTEPDRITLSTITAGSCPKSALEPPTSGGSTAYRAQVAQTIIGAQAAGGYNGTDELPLVLTVWVLHDGGTQNRNWIALMGYGGHAYNSGSLRTWVRIGMQNSPPANTSMYQGGVNVGWTGTFPINLDAGPDGISGTDPATRRPGQWVKFRMRVKTSTVEFLVDDVLYKVYDRPNTTDTFDSIRIGSGYTNTNSAIWYDNLSVSLGDADPFDTPLPLPTVQGPLTVGTNVPVTINNISLTATQVKVFANGVEVGSAAVSNQTSVVVTASALADGDVVQATQVLPEGESCLSYSRVKVFAQGIGPLRVALGAREITGYSGPEFADGGASGGIEWVGASKAGSYPRGQTITPGGGWQTITFDPNDPVYGFAGAYNGVLDSPSAPWYVLENLAFSIDPNNPKAGPYTLYIDAITTNSVTEGFESYAAPGANGAVMFHQPSFSGSTSAGLDLTTGPNVAVVTADQADPNDPTGTSKAMKVQWKWKDDATTRWLRLTTNNAANLPNPQLNLGVSDDWKPVTVRFLLCGAPDVTIGNILVLGGNIVTVLGTLSADTVSVYANGQLLVSVPGNQADSIDVPIPEPGLVADDVIQATQTIGGAEGCLGPAVKVGDCAQIGSPAIRGPLVAGQATVTVGCDIGANLVKIYRGGVEIGSATPAGDSDTVDVPITGTPALAAGDMIMATQTVQGLESCTPTSGPVVGSGGNAPLRIALGIREPLSPAGDDLEWVGASGPAGGPLAPTQAVTLSSGWQTLTFDDTSPVQQFTGNGIVDPDTTGVVRIDHLAIIRDAGNTDTGPYTLYIDEIKNGDTTLQGFETANPGDEVWFRQPDFSGSTSSFLLIPPNLSEVDDTQADVGDQSYRIDWQFIDGNAGRWLRLVTSGAPLPDISVDLTQTVTIRVLLLPALECPDPFADADGDGDVDQADFAVFQACFSGSGDDLVSGCECFDRDHDGDVDSDDAGAFEACASGPGIAADPDCD